MAGVPYALLHQAMRDKRVHADSAPTSGEEKLDGGDQRVYNRRIHTKETPVITEANNASSSPDPFLCESTNFTDTMVHEAVLDAKLRGNKNDACVEKKLRQRPMFLPSQNDLDGCASVSLGIELHTCSQEKYSSTVLYGSLCL